jgi:alkanesulfonate monooxygenase SsuD/methylene tetrahydromethanopterin reductase-like flavin-dependent oxidoreductase (luciferase family)
MKHGLSILNFGETGDARLLAEIASEAEAAGWDGCFLSDHVRWPAGDQDTIPSMPAVDPEPTADPWVALGAMAMRTERISLGTLVTPLPRRRPTKLAREVATLDQLTRGRTILGVGGGLWPEEFEALGDESDRKVRAAMLDEGLELLESLWSGEPVKHVGAHYRAETTAFAPPCQKPRIPIIVAATWPIRKMLHRAAKWDGVFPLTRRGTPLSPEEISELARTVSSLRITSEPFEILCQGQTQGNGSSTDAALVEAYEAAGGTWWIELRYPWEASLDELLSRVRKGPARG